MKDKQSLCNIRETQKHRLFFNSVFITDYALVILFLVILAQV